jgi:hypothetical protein
MKLKIIFILALLSNAITAQDYIKMTNNYGSQNKEIQDLIDFENIYIEQLNFSSLKLIGKSYKINIEEYKNGILLSTTKLFDGFESDYFKITTKEETLKFFFRLSDGKLKTYIRGKKFGSKKSYFNLMSDSDQYVLKDFFGNKEVINLDINSKNTLFAIITPTIHSDGSGSYCEVVQSEIKPEKLGEHFKIPHYFLITITFN